MKKIILFTRHGCINIFKNTNIAKTFFAIVIYLAVASCQVSDERSQTQQFRSLADDPRLINDKLFVLVEHRGGMRERDLAEIIIGRTNDPEMKQLAITMREGHQLGIDKLIAIASDLNMTLPSKISTSEKAELDTWRSIPPDELIRFYLVHQRAQHAWDITIFTDYENFAVNSKLKKYISETITPLRSHAEEIVKFANTKGINGGFSAIGAKD
jgi:predicted outer membrane protein